MKSVVYLAGLSLLIVGLAGAQTPQEQPQSTPSQSSSAPTQATTPPSTATQSTTSQSETSQKETTAKSGTMAEMKTESFKGALMDANCAGSSSTTAAANTSATTAAENSSTGNTGEQSKKHKQMASGAQGQACTVSSSTSQFALRLKDDRTLKFDSVGNLRAQEVLKTKWSKALESGKPIQAKVNGVVNGDTLTVVSID